MNVLQFLRRHASLAMLIAVWVASAVYAGPLLYLVMPLSVFLMWRRDLWPDMLFGFIITLVLSDMTPDIHAMRGFKTAKNTYIVALAGIFLMERDRLSPYAGIFKVYLPLFIYSCFPLLFAGALFVGIQKTLSYLLLFLVVPNYVLYAFRRDGWEFFRNLVLFLVSVLVAQRLFVLIDPGWWTHLSGRFRGFFGNPNGLAMFCYLVFTLFTVLIHLRKDLFPLWGKVIIYGIILYFLLKSGSRSSLVSTLIFLLFSRFFRVSPFLGFLAFIAFMIAVELVSNNLVAVVTALGIEQYFRLETLTDGSGRYFAWQFAWDKINEGGFFLFGGGFGNDEFIMRQNYEYLRSMGHHGGVHNSYLTLWFDLGIVGLIIYFRSFLLIFLKASKRVPIAFAVMFSVLFSVMYESWLAGSLNPFTILLLTILTVLTEDEILEQAGDAVPAPPKEQEEAVPAGPVFIPPAR